MRTWSGQPGRRTRFDAVQTQTFNNDKRVCSLSIDIITNTAPDSTTRSLREPPSTAMFPKVRIEFSTTLMSWEVLQRCTIAEITFMSTSWWAITLFKDARLFTICVALTWEDRKYCDFRPKKHQVEGFTEMRVLDFFFFFWENRVSDWAFNHTFEQASFAEIHHVQALLYGHWVINDLHQYLEQDRTFHHAFYNCSNSSYSSMVVNSRHVKIVSSVCSGSSVSEWCQERLS